MHKKYVTPDGQVITQKEIDENKRREEEKNLHTPEVTDGDYGYHDSDDQYAPEIEEFNDETSREDYIDEMQRLIDKMKNDQSEK